MTKASDNVFPRLLVSEGGSTATPAAATVTVYAKADGLLYSKDDAGTETALGGGAGSVATDAIWDAAGDLAVGTGADSAGRVAIGANGTVLTSNGTTAGWAAPAGGGLVGPTLIAAPIGMSMEATSSAGTADTAYLAIVPVVSAMLVRALAVRVGTAGSGTVEWGLFDVSSDPAAATKIAGGSGALNATGWVEIAAASAPVTTAAGTYILIIHLPATNQPAIHRAITTSQANKIGKSQASYTWDDTPDLSTGWTDSTVVTTCYIRGDLDGSTQW